MSNPIWRKGDGMSDPRTDNIEDLLRNGEEVPKSVTNRALLRGQQALWKKIDAIEAINRKAINDRIEAAKELDKRLTGLEHFKTKATTWGAAFVVFWSVFVTVLNWLVL